MYAWVCLTAQQRNALDAVLAPVGTLRCFTRPTLTSKIFDNICVVHLPPVTISAIQMIGVNHAPCVIHRDNNIAMLSNLVAVFFGQTRTRRADCNSHSIPGKKGGAGCPTPPMVLRNCKYSADEPTSIVNCQSKTLGSLERCHFFLEIRRIFIGN